MLRRIRSIFRRWLWRRVKDWPEIRAELTIITINGSYFQNASVIFDAESKQVKVGSTVFSGKN